MKMISFDYCDNGDRWVEMNEMTDGGDFGDFAEYSRKKRPRLDELPEVSFDLSRLLWS